MISINWKSESYNSILVILNWLLKKIYYKLVKVVINVLKLVKVIFNIKIWQYNLSNSIITNSSLLFIFKF